MDLAESLARHRQELARRLRGLRIDADLSGTDLARRLEWSQSRVSRIETARQLPTEDEVRDICRELAAPKAVLNELLGLLRGVEQEWTDIRLYETFGSQQRQEEVREAEAKAKDVFIFQQALVPGLLQTPDYTRCLAEVSGVFSDPADVEHDVSVRKERQQALLDRSKHFTFVVMETALWNRYGSGFVMHEQYEHLLEVLDWRSVRLGIIPRTAKLPLLPLTGFNIYGDDIVTIETITSRFSLRHPTDVADHRKMFDSLTATAVTGKQARAIIREVGESVV